MEERSKFREETLVNVGDVRRRSQKPPLEERFSSEYIVVRATLGVVNLALSNTVICTAEPLLLSGASRILL